MMKVNRMFNIFIKYIDYTTYIAKILELKP